MQQNSMESTPKALTKPISPCLWFDDQAEEAARLYTSVFPNSTITSVSRFGVSWQVVPVALHSMR